MELPRARAETPRPAQLELAEPAGLGVRPGPLGGTRHREPLADNTAPAGMIVRFVAVAIDFAILLAIDVLVVYFTMEICGLTAADVEILPKAPLIAFFIVQNGGYLVAFTAGGQTLGKMAMGIKVVMANGEPVEFGSAMLRYFGYWLSWLILGIGYLMIAFSAEKRGLHDNIAGTVVIRTR